MGRVSFGRRRAAPSCDQREAKKMKLITKEIERKLLANGANRDKDHVPVLKLFYPAGAQTWLISEMDPDEHDWHFGLADLGFGTPELGTISLSALSEFKGRLGLGIKRDMWFEGKWPLSVYADKARAAGRIEV
jgi:Protein of unknown function (DUF2958)